MIGLYALKPWYTRMLTPILNTAVAQKVSPDVFTAAGVVAAEPIDPHNASARQLRAQVIALKESSAPETVSRYALAA